MSLAFQAATVSVADDVGYESVRLHVDPNDARMRWFGKKMRTDANFRIAGGDGRREIVAEPPSDPPQRLLEVADLFVFVAGRALPPESCRAKSRYEEMYRMCRPRLG